MGMDCKQILHDNQRLFCEPVPYLIGAGTGLVVAALTNVTAPISGALLGTPLGPVGLFVYHSLDCMGTSTTAQVARAAVAFFATLLIATMVASIFGTTTPFAHGSFVMLSALVALVATGVLAYNEGWKIR